MRETQTTLQILRLDGKPDGRSARWKKTRSFSKLARQGHFGDSIRYRKSRRPFSSKQAIHTVLKSDHATGPLRFTNPTLKLNIEKMARDLAVKSKLTLYKIAIAHDHIHILVRGKKPETLTNFHESFAGVLAKRMRKSAKAKGKKLPQGSFWSARPYSTLVRFGRHWRYVLGYLEKNTNEAFGFVTYTPRNHAIQKVLMNICDRLKKQSAGFSSA